MERTEERLRRGCTKYYPLNLAVERFDDRKSPQKRDRTSIYLKN
ncbi:hypothetical protein NIES2104_47140 [Leptolyngbya sp. NIES-2104]|nr:hypothetical protein NIES2104_47140 [Leptolyngbya sp. NIES-2104]